VELHFQERGAPAGVLKISEKQYKNLEKIRINDIILTEPHEPARSVFPGRAK
jgi:hypothetical protein